MARSRNRSKPEVIFNILSELSKCNRLTVYNLIFYTNTTYTRFYKIAEILINAKLIAKVWDRDSNKNYYELTPTGLMFYRDFSQFFEKYREIFEGKI